MELAFKNWKVSKQLFKEYLSHIILWLFNKSFICDHVYSTDLLIIANIQINPQEIVVIVYKKGCSFVLEV